MCAISYIGSLRDELCKRDIPICEKRRGILQSIEHLLELMCLRSLSIEILSYEGESSITVLLHLLCEYITLSTSLHHTSVEYSHVESSKEELLSEVRSKNIDIHHLS